LLATANPPETADKPVASRWRCNGKRGVSEDRCSGRLRCRADLPARGRRLSGLRARHKTLRSASGGFSTAPRPGGVSGRDQHGGSATSWWRRLVACSPRRVFVCRIANAQIWPSPHGASTADWQSASRRPFRAVCRWTIRDTADFQSALRRFLQEDAAASAAPLQRAGFGSVRRVQLRRKGPDAV